MKDQRPDGKFQTGTTGQEGGSQGWAFNLVPSPKFGSPSAPGPDRRKSHGRGMVGVPWNVIE